MRRGRSVWQWRQRDDYAPGADLLAAGFAQRVFSKAGAGGQGRGCENKEVQYHPRATDQCMLIFTATWRISR